MRIKELDGLRGLAAFSVVLFHYTNKSNSYSEDVLFFEYGHFGVELFFIISGFVISLTLNRKKNFLHFWKARFYRLFPIYWVCMILTFLTTSFIGLDYMKRSFEEFLLNLPMVSRFLNVKFIDGAYWSLQYELFFYLIIAVIYYVFSKKLKNILFIFGFLTSIELLINVFDINNLITDYGGIISTLYYRMYGILTLEYIHLFTIGIALYALVLEKKKWAWYFIAYGVLVSMFIALEDFIATSVIMLIIASALWLKLSIWRNSIMLWLGSISYVLYLLHMFIGRSIIEELINRDITSYISIAIGILLILGLSTVVHEYVEKPMYSYLTGRKPKLSLPTSKE